MVAISARISTASPGLEFAELIASAPAVSTIERGAIRDVPEG